ncbi:MAG: hypothetical protein WC843_03485 [Candidatus Gracilibacteria bacterium]
MRLAELLTNVHPDQPDFTPYLRPGTHPPLKTEALKLEALVGEQRKALRTVVDGIGTIVIRYKGSEGAVTSLDEDHNGETWTIKQVQGASSRRSYRTATGLHWPKLLSERIATYANHPEAQARHITMPPLHGITNIDGARSQHIDSTYAAARTTLGMRYSEEHGLYIVDIKK